MTDTISLGFLGQAGETWTGMLMHCTQEVKKKIVLRQPQF